MTENKAKQKLYGGVRGKMKTKTKIHTIDVVPKPGGRGREGDRSYIYIYEKIGFLPLTFADGKLVVKYIHINRE